MDRFVVREPRMESQQGNNSMLSPSIASGNANMGCHDNTFYQGTYTSEYPNILRSPSFAAAPHNLMNMNPMTSYRNDMMPGQVMSGIDPNYLANYNHNAAFIATGQQQPIHRPSVQMNTAFEYQNRSFIGAERNSTKQFIPHSSEYQTENASRRMKSLPEPGIPVLISNRADLKLACPKTNEAKPLKSEVQNQVPLLSRSEKLKALQKIGPRSFTGPVEKVLKWHKALQDMGILIIYEIIGKCVSIRSGEACAKCLVVRDEGGPAIQVVYYEIDFLLQEIKPPCTVRVVGRMLAGTSRLQAFNIRPANGDDVAILPRRAAVAAHHIAKICKEYGN